ncbi:hypothetical protein LP419_09690 [Massilia sp. H-1]|nr:hypothetical protein LP419_09690 [Massilia sp. H-1]
MAWITIGVLSPPPPPQADKKAASARQATGEKVRCIVKVMESLAGKAWKIAK